MRGIIRAAAPAGLLAAVLAAGCSAAAPAPYQATLGTCYAFGVQAIQRHTTVTTVPRACAGLSHEQVNLAVARAIRAVVGRRPRAVTRRLAYAEGAYLEHLITTVPPAKPAPAVAAPTRPSDNVPVSLAALAAWIVTAAAGGYLLAGWLAHGGLRRRPSRAAGLPPVVIISHFTVAVAGLAIWIAFVVTDLAILAWIAVGLILLAAGLGMATLAGALPEPAANSEPASSGPAGSELVSPGPVSSGPAGPGPVSSGPAGPGPVSSGPAGPGPLLATRIAATAAPAGRRMPVAVIAVHGVLATVTILLVLLAAISAGR